MDLNRLETLVIHLVEKSSEVPLTTAHTERLTSFARAVYGVLTGTDLQRLPRPYFNMILLDEGLATFKNLDIFKTKISGSEAIHTLALIIGVGMSCQGVQVVTPGSPPSLSAGARQEIERIFTGIPIRPIIMRSLQRALLAFLWDETPIAVPDVTYGMYDSPDSHLRYALLAPFTRNFSRSAQNLILELSTGQQEVSCPENIRPFHRALLCISLESWTNNDRKPLRWSDEVWKRVRLDHQRFMHDTIFPGKPFTAETWSASYPSKKAEYHQALLRVMH